MSVHYGRLSNMKSIFSRTSFPRAPGGDGYEWKMAETKFQISTKGLFDLKEYILRRAHWAILYFQLKRKPYSADFLEHALKANPPSLVFQPTDQLAKKIKIDPIYKKITQKLKEKLTRGILNGEIWPEDFKNDEEMSGKINFNSYDLDTSIHGIHKIEYRAKPIRGNKFDVQFVMFDIYDFSKQPVSFFFADIKGHIKGTINNELDIGEILELVHNFEIAIHLQETLAITH